MYEYKCMMAGKCMALIHILSPGEASVECCLCHLQGPYQMLFSHKSPLFAKGLNIFFRILYLSPCYIYIVSALGTPTFMAIPIIYIWSGRFPAVLTATVISWMIAYTVLSYMIKCYVRPGRNILHDFR